ncbi:hypothetical protein SADUNF_Sadunf11G0049300 [Salix dunnii]|uniref:Senescence regulator n=1 Tax=Salix dunnii TaxID=1413687 RepID=A0A835JT31_9ROSI|nr:hypothetical protein SADUNF_Sadunf11G0049300 [Salix dunnii]
MAEELHESEVIFSDDEHERRKYFNYQEMGVLSSNNKKVKKKKQKQSSSVPVIIPSRVYKLSDNDDFEEDDAGEEGLVPPHVIVERRIAGKMAFSVCTGNGRTLKGRDLSEVRNSILRMTGFLEA